jgi:uncharacterized protein with GYD domain
VRKLIEGAGGKLVSFYFTTGDTDFMVVSEANEGESIISVLWKPSRPPLRIPLQSKLLPF